MSEQALPKLLFRIGEVAERLSISKPYAYRLVASGQIASVRLGKCVRVPAAELEAFVRKLAAGEEGRHG